MVNQQDRLHSTPFSVLDLAPIVEGGTIAEAFEASKRLAQLTESLQYQRFWVAEHHNMPGIASAATSLVIQHLAQATSTMRIGSGGIMLPNHSSLVIAEQFGTLDALFPGRIDLGLGRAPGTDRVTSQALRRNLGQTGYEFPDQLDELMAYFSPKDIGGLPMVRAFPGEGAQVPIWLLGSSDFSARLAGQLGLPFAFASHFSPENTTTALRVYRTNFTPSSVLSQPYAMVAANVIAADTSEEAHYLATSMQQQFLNLIRDVRRPLPAPIKDINQSWSEHEKAIVNQRIGSSIVGNREEVKGGIEAFLAETEADELMIQAQIFDLTSRLRSYEIIADLKAK
ncbi:LLM class flavin-dependent oxidoreductase [Aureibacillus halotolerans]|uniref:Luciferase family oxidoreductase group 1 n=1 Tax=Aureibacillus halotolerans TaxID=1508390 RepID=A0A4R6U9U8_9BACI|nr:LLM class flavin-dependent oxidoreductase [Aureibacillus halotolerans]TDQ42606.1 luciferase family oxidoreductase group 1 [Aureibacillus halotolerans]